MDTPYTVAHSDSVSYIDRDSNLVAQTFGAQKEEKAERIAACLNFCRNVDTAAFAEIPGGLAGLLLSTQKTVGVSSTKSPDDPKLKQGDRVMTSLGNFREAVTIAYAYENCVDEDLWVYHKESDTMGLECWFLIDSVDKATKPWREMIDWLCNDESESFVFSCPGQTAVLLRSKITGMTVELLDREEQ